MDDSSHPNHPDNIDRPPQYQQSEPAVSMATPVAQGASQATAIEQTRAVAEVQGALVVAQQRPRDIARARHNILESCKIPAFAERAFFTYKRGGERINDVSIHFATELARCWGNIDYGIKELERKEHSSEMLAFAWDLETNTRIENVFDSPHLRHTKHGTKTLTDNRDIYENNANLAARRLRECIKRCLPPWLIEEAKDACRHTVEHGGGVPLEQRIGQAVEFAGENGLSKDDLEKTVGRPTNQWTGSDVANLRIKFQSLKRGEITLAEAFEIDRASTVAKELAAPSEPQEPAPEPKPTPETSARPIR